MSEATVETTTVDLADAATMIGGAAACYYRALVNGGYPENQAVVAADVLADRLWNHVGVPDVERTFADDVREMLIATPDEFAERLAAMMATVNGDDVAESTTGE